MIWSLQSWFSQTTQAVPILISWSVARSAHLIRVGYLNPPCFPHHCRLLCCCSPWGFSIPPPSQHPPVGSAGAVPFIPCEVCQADHLSGNWHHMMMLCFCCAKCLIKKSKSNLFDNCLQKCRIYTVINVLLLQIGWNCILGQSQT